MKLETHLQIPGNINMSKKTTLNVMVTQNCIAEHFSEVLRPFDLSAEQFNVLRILRGQKGKLCNMSTIQERMIAKTSNTTRLVDKLLLKEFVTRQVCKDNRRKMEIGITKQGLAILEELDPLVIAHEVTFSSRLTDEELEQLNYLLEKIRTI